jgi:hypothetical protein
MISLEAVAMEAAKVAVRELLNGVVARQALVEAQMYGDDATDEELCITATIVLAAGTMAWMLVDGEETVVEDEDDDEEAEAAADAQRDGHLRAAEVRIKAAAEAERAATDADRVAEAEAEEREAVERAAHWAAEMDKALAYRRDVDRRDIAWREAARRAETGHRIEQCMIARRQEAAIRATMAAIEAAGVVGNGDAGTLH